MDTTATLASLRTLAVAGNLRITEYEASQTAPRTIYFDHIKREHDEAQYFVVFRPVANGTHVICIEQNSIKQTNPLSDAELAELQEIITLVQTQPREPGNPSRYLHIGTTSVHRATI